MFFRSFLTIFAFLGGRRQWVIAGDLIEDKLAYVIKELAKWADIRLILNVPFDSAY